LVVEFYTNTSSYLTFASVFITVKSITTELHDNNNKFNFSDLFKNQVFYTVIVSLASTYVLWFVASFLFFDPWHMFTSFIQYLLLTPSYINILNVYAFCNTHDITWGTKGDDKAEKLPSANLKPGGKVDVNIPTDDGDLNHVYEQELVKFSSKAPEEKREVSASEKQEDYYKGFRSGVVIFWLVCNFALVATVQSTAGLERLGSGSSSDANAAAEEAADATRKSTIYMAVVLWSVAGLSAFKFIGAMWFLIIRMFRGV
jgi:chitin synthase